MAKRKYVTLEETERAIENTLAFIDTQFKNVSLTTEFKKRILRLMIERVEDKHGSN